MDESHITPHPCLNKQISSVIIMLCTKKHNHNNIVASAVIQHVFGKCLACKPRQSWVRSQAQTVGGGRWRYGSLVTLLIHDFITELQQNLDFTFFFPIPPPKCWFDVWVWNGHNIYLPHEYPIKSIHVGVLILNGPTGFSSLTCYTKGGIFWSRKGVLEYHPFTFKFN